VTHKLRLAFLSVALLGLGACSSPSLDELGGQKTLWELGVDGVPLDVSSLSGSSSVQIDPDGGTLSGAGGCNEFDGSFIYSGGTLTPSDVFFTAMGCANPVGLDIDSALMEILSAPFEVSGDSQRMVWEGSGIRVVYIQLED
jgi:heat shock protein HslJ